MKIIMRTIGAITVKSAVVAVKSTDGAIDAALDYIEKNAITPELFVGEIWNNNKLSARVRYNGETLEIGQ